MGLPFRCQLLGNLLGEVFQARLCCSHVRELWVSSFTLISRQLIKLGTHEFSNAKMFFSAATGTTSLRRLQWACVFFDVVPTPGRRRFLPSTSKELVWYLGMCFACRKWFFADFSEVTNPRPPSSLCQIFPSFPSVKQRELALPARYLQLSESRICVFS